MGIEKSQSPKVDVSQGRSDFLRCSVWMFGLSEERAMAMRGSNHQGFGAVKIPSCSHIETKSVPFRYSV
jgi:hypothetical protein